MMMFFSALPEEMMYRFGKLYKGRPINIKTRADLLASIKPTYWKHLRDDTGDVPRTEPLPPEERQLATAQTRLRAPRPPHHPSAGGPMVLPDAWSHV